jgi:tryptophan synthase alpha chain
MLAQNRIVGAFHELRSRGKKALLPFITAGYPDLDTTAALLRDFAARGVRICELGIPFSDPIADGPVIQASYTEALAAGVNSDKVFAMVRQFRASRAEDASPGNSQFTIHNSQLALIAMVSYSILFRHGVESYLDQARAAGLDGLIIPDLPLDEAAGVESLAAQRGLCNVMLIAPTTAPNRRLEIARHSRGFIYYISVAGITGERDRLPAATIAAVAELRRHTETPVCVGFGVSNPATVAEVCRVADGAIVGSAIVKRIAVARAAGAGRDELVAQVGSFVGELLAPVT